MNNLSIYIVDKQTTKINGLPSCWGEIKINQFKEEFIISLGSWTLDDYQRQWADGIERVKLGNKSCLVASVQNIRNKPLINWWVLYPERNQVFIQNHLLFGKEFAKKLANKPFDSVTCYNYIPPRETISDEGNKISEWTIDLKDLDNC